MYDALNVLMAMDIIKKQKKKIIWVGLPPQLDSGAAGWAAHVDDGASELGRLRKRRDQMRSIVAGKRRQREELLVQERCAQTTQTDVQTAVLNDRCCDGRCPGVYKSYSKKIGLGGMTRPEARAAGQSERARADYGRHS